MLRVRPYDDFRVGWAANWFIMVEKRQIQLHCNLKYFDHVATAKNFA